LAVQPAEPDWINHRPRERYGPWHAKGHSPVPHFSPSLEVRTGAHPGIYLIVILGSLTIEDPERPARGFGSQLVRLHAAPKSAVMLPIRTPSRAPVPLSLCLTASAPRRPGLPPRGHWKAAALLLGWRHRQSESGALDTAALVGVLRCSPLLSPRPHRMSCTRMV
jgi:hypothetical protein